MAATGGDNAKANSVDMDVPSSKELRRKLEELKLSVKGSDAVLSQRLRRALTGSTSKDAADAEIRDGGDEIENDVTDVDLLSIAELKMRLCALGLKTMGNKAVLRERLKTAIEETDESDEDEDVDDDEDEHVDDDEDVDDGESKEPLNKNAVKRSSKRSVNTTRETRRDIRHIRQATLSFKDVEDALETFSGDEGENIHRWLINIEETAELCQ